MTAVLTDQVFLLARRSVVRTIRQPANILAPMIFPMMLLAVNSGGLKAETLLPGFPTQSMVAFLLAIPFIQGALFATMNAGTDLARDIQTGFLNRLSLTPMRGVALLAGHLGGVVTLGLVQATFYLGVGLAVGVRLASGILGAVVLFAFALLVALAFGAMGTLVGLRTGSGEAVQGFFPMFFVLLFISSMAIPRNLISITWFRDVATVNPVSYLLECVRSLIITGWDGEALALGFGVAGTIAVVGLFLSNRALRGRMGRIVRTLSVARGVAWRMLHNVFTNPALFIPSLLFPLFFFTAFAGGLSGIARTPGFDFPDGYTAFQFVFVLLQSAAFGGVFTGFGIARDFESGFARRLLLAAPHRSGIVLGYAIAALVRWLVTVAVLTVIALLVGMNISGDGIDLVGLYGLGLLVNAAAVLWASGVAMRLRTMQAGPIMQMPVFLILFFAPVYVPLTLLTGWIHDVAVINPLTRVVEAARALLAGTPTEVGAAYATGIALAAVFSLWALRGLRKAEAAG